MSAELTMTASVLDTIEKFLAEVGAPLTPEQLAAFTDARTLIAVQQAVVVSFDRLLEDKRRESWVRTKGGDA